MTPRQLVAWFWSTVRPRRYGEPAAGLREASTAAHVESRGRNGEGRAMVRAACGCTIPLAQWWTHDHAAAVRPADRYVTQRPGVVGAVMQYVRRSG